MKNDNKFRLCAFADEAGADIELQINALVENGIEFIELRGINGKNVSKLTIDEAKEAKERFDKSGIKVWSIGSPIGKIKITDEFAPHLETFHHVLDLAKLFGAECIRLFSFYIPKDEDPASYRQEVISRMTEIYRAAQGSGILLCHENEKGIYGDNAERCLDILSSVPGYKGIFDPANFIQIKQDIKSAWQMLEPYIYYMHIKDAVIDGKVVPAGRGDGDIPYLLEKYKRIGSGVLSLEPHLSVFDGLKALENEDEKSVVDEFTYKSQREAFDAAVNALKSLI